MENLDISKEMKDCIEGLASLEGATVEEYLKKALKTVRWVQKEWAAPVPPSEEKPSQVQSNPSYPAPDKAVVEVDGKKYRSKTYNGLMQEVVTDLGCKRVFDALVETGGDNRFVTKLPEGARVEFFKELHEGGYHFWIRTNVSKKDVTKFIEKVAKNLNLPVRIHD